MAAEASIYCRSGEVALFYTLYSGGGWSTPVPLTAPDDIAFGAENNAKDHSFRVVDQGTDVLWP